MVMPIRPTVDKKSIIQQISPTDLCPSRKHLLSKGFVGWERIGHRSRIAQKVVIFQMVNQI